MTNASNVSNIDQYQNFHRAVFAKLENLQRGLSESIPYGFFTWADKHRHEDWSDIVAKFENESREAILARDLDSLTNVIADYKAEFLCMVAIYMREKEIRS